VLGTVMVSDIFPGSISGLQYFEPFIITDSFMVFTGDDPIHGREPWKSDGTTNGTYLLIDANPGPVSSDPSAFLGYTPIPGFHFIASSANTGLELFYTDAIGPSSTMSCDIYPGQASSEPICITALDQFSNPHPITIDSKLWLLALSTGNNDAEIWSFNNSTLSCSQIIDLNPGPARGIHSNIFFICNNKYIFIGNDGTSGKEVWSFDSLSTTNVSHNDKPNIQFYAYPNPYSYSKLVPLQIMSSEKIVNIKIEDSLGRILVDVSITDHINTSNLTNGLYIIKATTLAGTTISSKLIIQN